MKNSNNVELIELKEKTIEKILKTIVAFLNSNRNGKIYVGILNNGKILGISKNNDNNILKNKIKDFSNILDKIYPDCKNYVIIKQKIIEGKDVICIEIKKNNSFFIIKKYGFSEKGCFKRLENVTKPMKIEEIEKRLKESLIVPEITEIVSKKKDLTFKTLEHFLNCNNYKINDKNFQKDFFLINEKGKYNLMSEILSDKNDINVSISFFDSEDKTNFLRKKDFNNESILSLIGKVENYIEDFFKKEKKDFDFLSFKLAWINACVHNKWSKSNHLGIYIYSNRLEIETYGGISEKIKKSEFLKGKSKPVNENLFKIFKLCGFVKGIGEGVQKIIKEYGVHSFKISDNFVNVIIPFDNNKLLKEQNKEVNRNIKEDIIKFLKKNPESSIDKIAINLKKNKNTIQYHINKLKKNGKIIHRGSDKGGFWEVFR